MKIIFWVIFLSIATIPAVAQDVPRVEVFGGYSWAGGNFHGVTTSVTGNINSWFGVTADFSGHYGSEQAGSIRIKQNAHTFQVGPRFSRRGKRVTPFAYALVGVIRFDESATIAGQHVSRGDTGFASSIGGGLDVTVNKRVAIRAFQIDYFRPQFFDETHDRFRFAFGVVFRFGN